MVIDFSTDDWHRIKPQTKWQEAIFTFLREWENELDFVTGKSSGSTGVPKKLKLYKQPMTASAQRTNAFFGLGPQHKYLLALPTEFVGGKMQLLRAYLNKARLICLHPTLRIALNETIDFAALTPTQLEQSLDTVLPFCRTLILGGSPTTSDLINRCRKSDCTIYETYGMTETYSHIALKKRHPNQQDYFCALNGVELSLNENNCLQISDSYTGTSKLDTNDLVRLEKKEFKILGRLDNVINSGGLKISPEEIETQLKAYSSVVELIITSLPDPTFGERIVLLTTNPLTKNEFDELIQHLPEKNKRPKEHYVLARFCYTENGKIQRKKTRAALFQQLGLLP